MNFPRNKWTLLIITSLLLLAQGQKPKTLHRLVGGHLAAKQLSTAMADDTELIITSSAGGGKRDSKNNKSDGSEDKKTLAQQVADGKYGLIQNELFSKPIKRPGLISYEANSEVPKDNINNLGGLSKDDIWLAENHLLVIRGGSFSNTNNNHKQQQETETVWPPIDDYKAPGRQVKLPSNPKVPPPFPVQLTEDGPLQILGTNFTATLNGSFSAAPYPLPPLESNFYPAAAYSPPASGSEHSTNFTSGETPFPIPAFPADFNSIAQPQKQAMNFTIGAMPPFFASLPPGAAILPPPGNITSMEYDDDDPSIYYPPPYSFFYQMDNATQVPPGPLVPGIVLPPPPNFFAPLEKPSHRKKPSQIHRVTTTEIMRQVKPPTTVIPPTPLKPSRINNLEELHHHITPIPITKTKLPKVIINVEDTTPQPPPPPRVITIVPYLPQGNEINRTEVQKIRSRPENVVTLLKPIKTITTPRPIYYYENNNEGKIKIYAPPTSTRPRTSSISSTKVPLKAYFSTSNEIDSNAVVTQVPEIDYYKSRPTTTKGPRQYYFYEEQPQVNSITTQRSPKQSSYFSLPNEYYPIKTQQNVRENYLQAVPPPPPPPLPQQEQQHQNPYFYRTPSRPTGPNRYRLVESSKNPADTFSLHVARLKQQIHQYYTTPEPYLRYEHQRPSTGPKPVYQFSFQAANYQSQHAQNQQQQQQLPQRTHNNIFRASPIDDVNDDINFRPINSKYSVEIQPAIEVLPTRQTYQNHQPHYFNRHVAQIAQQLKQTSTERPVSTKYYPSARPSDYEYEDVEIVKQTPLTATPRPISQYSFEAPQNPLYHQSYYNAKQEESYFDDMTKKYFTIFGKKIPAPTTPIPTAVSSKRPNVQIQYAQQTVEKSPQVSLHGDTLVNYAHPRPTLEPQAEYIRPVNIRRPHQQHHLQQHQQSLQHQQTLQHQQSLQQHKHQQQHHQQTEIVEAIPVKIATSAEGKPGSFISYELPGDDGAHFYFLTPQLAQRRDQGAGFYYESTQAKQQKQQNLENRNQEVNNGNVES